MKGDNELYQRKIRDQNNFVKGNSMGDEDKKYKEKLLDTSWTDLSSSRCFTFPC